MILLFRSTMKNISLNNLLTSAQVSLPARASRPAGRSTMLGALKLLLLATLLPAAANATTWYVDSTATSGAKNGTSWASAWTSLSSISGVKAGDTVYISGGPSGSSQTYSTGTWSPAGGSSGSIITYQIGQDSAHNGTAVFATSGMFLNPASYVAIVGDAGDGQMHFAVTGISTIMWWQGGSLSHLRLGYINFGQVSGSGANPEDVMYLNSVNGFEFDHNYVNMVSPKANAFVYMVTTDSGFDGTRIHDNTIYLPGNYGAGADGFELGGSTGYSIFNNKIYATTMSSYSGGQHQDGWQDTGGSSYIKIYNNYMQGLGNSCFFADGYYGGFTHLYIYNNIGVMTTTVVNGWYPEGCTVRPDGDSSTKVFTDVRVMNNLFADQQTEFGVSIGANIYGSGFSASFSGCVIQNNISINTGVGSPTGAFASDSSVSTANNVSFYMSADNGDFTKYTQYSTSSDFHLTSAATALIKTGVNESAYFTTDKDGNARPASGGWDIGPYAYGSTGSGGSTNPVTPTLTVTPVTQNASDVDTTSGGVQVFEGTVVTYSAAATETGTGTVSYVWSYTVNGGPSITGPSGTGTVPSYSFTYGTGTAGNTYVVTITVNDGVRTATSSLTMSVEAPPAPNTSLTFQAASGTITAPFTLTGNYISQPVQTTVISSAGEATYTFSITNAGNYVVQALVNAPSDAANSFYVNIDAQPVDPTMCWDVTMTSGFQSRLVSWRGTGTDTNNQYVPKVFSLTAGTHQIIFAGREANTQLQSFSILALPATPQNLRVLPNVMGNAPTFSAGP